MRPTRTSLALALLGVVGVAALTRLAPAGDDPAERATLTVSAPALTLPEATWVPLRGTGRLESPVRLDGAWAFLDPTRSEVLVLPDSGRIAFRFGRPGDGPGELRYAELLAAAGDTLWVGQVTAARFDAFSREGGFLRRLTVDTQPCGAPVLQALATAPGALLVGLRCFDPSGRLLLVRLDAATGRTEARSWPGPRSSVGPLSPARVLLSSGSRGLLTASSDAPCLRRADGRPERCLSEEDRVRIPRGERDSLLVLLGPSARRLGLRPEVPTHYPYLEAVFAGPEGPVLSRPHPGGRVVHPAAQGPGSPSWVLRLDERTRAFVAGDRLLLVRDGAGGPEVARHRIRPP